MKSLTYEVQTWTERREDLEIAVSRWLKSKSQCWTFRLIYQIWHLVTFGFSPLFYFLILCLHIFSIHYNKGGTIITDHLVPKRNSHLFTREDTTDKTFLNLLPPPKTTWIIEPVPHIKARHVSAGPDWGCDMATEAYFTFLIPWFFIGTSIRVRGPEDGQGGKLRPEDGGLAIKQPKSASGSVCLHEHNKVGPLFTKIKINLWLRQIVARLDGAIKRRPQ